MDRVVTRGDTPRRAYKLFNLNNAPLDLAGHTVWLTVKPTVDNDITDSTAILKHYIQFNLDGSVAEAKGFEVGGIDPDPASDTFGELLSGATSGVVTHVIPQEDSTLMTIGTWVYDVAVMGPLLPDGSRYFETPILAASFQVKGDITRRITVP